MAGVGVVGTKNIAGAQAVGDDGADGGVNRFGRLIFGEAVAEHHGGGPNLRDGVGEIFAGDVRCSAAGGFVKAEGLLAAGGAEAGAGQHAEGAGQRGGFIAEDIAKKIFTKHHVKLRGPQQELHGGVVHEHVLEGYIWIIGGHARHHVAPEHAVFQHVGLVNAHHVLAAELCALKAHVRDALDLTGAVNHGVHRALLAVLKGLGVFRLAKIHAAGQLAHDQQINAVALPLSLERAGVRQLGGEFHRAEIGEETKLLAECEQGGALGAFFFRDIGITIRQAHRAKQDRIALATQCQCVLGQRLAGCIDARPADRCLGDVQLKSKFALGRVQHFQRLAHHFRPNAIAGQRGDFICTFTHVRKTAAQLRRTPAWREANSGDNASLSGVGSALNCWHEEVRFTFGGSSSVRFVGPSESSEPGLARGFERSPAGRT